MLPPPLLLQGFWPASISAMDLRCMCGARNSPPPPPIGSRRSDRRASMGLLALLPPPPPPAPSSPLGCPVAVLPCCVPCCRVGCRPAESPSCGATSSPNRTPLKAVLLPPATPAASLLCAVPGGTAGVVLPPLPPLSPSAVATVPLVLLSPLAAAARLLPCRPAWKLLAESCVGSPRRRLLVKEAPSCFGSLGADLRAEASALMGAVIDRGTACSTSAARPLTPSRSVAAPHRSLAQRLAVGSVAAQHREEASVSLKTR